MQYCKITLIIVGALLAIMGVAGLPGVSDMGTEPDWHAILKIIIGIVAVIIALMEKKEWGNPPHFFPFFNNSFFRMKNSSAYPDWFFDF